MSKKPSCQTRFFYGFSLADRVPQQHLLRSVHRVIDRQAIWRLSEPFYSRTGAPSVDPVVVLKMSLLGYFYGITSERRLAEECRLNLAFMWFLGYDLEETPPDHSILSKARARFGRELYERFFGLVVKACRDAGLIVGDALVMDATLLKANASLDSLVSRSLHTQLSSTQTYLDQLWAENPTGDADGADETSEPTSVPTRREGAKKTAAELRANERRVSKTDPDSAIVVKDLYGLFLAHKVHIAVDGGKARVVTAVITTPGDGAECRQVVALLGQHIWLVRRRPGEVVADKAYGTRDVYRLLRNHGVKPTVPGRKTWKGKRAQKLAAGFRYDAQADMYVCPEGKKLYRVSQKKDGSVLYKVHRLACRRCPKRATICRAGRPSLTRHGKDDVLAWAESHLATPGARLSLRRRMSIVEPVFTEMKGPRGLARASLRRNWKVHTQALLAMAAHNLRQLARAMGSLKEPANRTVGVRSLSRAFLRGWIASAHMA